ncbi:hypothetical protein PoB_004040700 [Plakobranchus ocellatus]|uniref:Uncharacterized protein n=1 Tax=Plakobranchus ocellatus TaxID=259542 RepID=A0AAV4B3X5_9GAST|nr:hypothetical protein PoB_004040700 [Plakobranchus ocellatus]
MYKGLSSAPETILQLVLNVVVLEVQAANIGEERPEEERDFLSCLLKGLSVCADYLFGCEEDAETRRKREAEEEAARIEATVSGATASGSSIEEVTVTTTDSAQWIPTNRGS